MKPSETEKIDFEANTMLPNVLVALFIFLEVGLGIGAPHLALILRYKPSKSGMAGSGRVAGLAE